MIVAGSIPKRIKGLSFALLSPDEIRKMAGTKVITADTYDDDGFPIEMGLMDPRLGVMEPGLRCKTCGRKVDECPGHFGLINLAMPVIHVGYTKIIKNILKSTCRKCGRILLTQKAVDDYRTEIVDFEDCHIEMHDVGKIHKGL
jgi:DNA-directed RNA polymerase subunit A'